MRALERQGAARQLVVHTGQHYDRKMSDEILDDLGFPAPDLPQPGRDLVVAQDPEPAPFVVRPVPRHVRERRQGQREDPRRVLRYHSYRQSRPGYVAIAAVTCPPSNSRWARSAIPSTLWQHHLNF